MASYSKWEVETAKTQKNNKIWLGVKITLANFKEGNAKQLLESKFYFSMLIVIKYVTCGFLWNNSAGLIWQLVEITSSLAKVSRNAKQYLGFQRSNSVSTMPIPSFDKNNQTAKVSNLFLQNNCIRS